MVQEKNARCGIRESRFDKQSINRQAFIKNLFCAMHWGYINTKNSAISFLLLRERCIFVSICGKNIYIEYINV